MDITKSLGAFLIAVLLGFSGYLYGHQSSVVSQDGQKAGSITSPDSPWPYYSVGGLQIYSIRTTSLNSATTTPCVIQSPVATSSLDYFGVNFVVGSTTAKNIVFTKGAAPNATTTALSGLLALAANAQGAFIASSTNAEATRVIAPSQYLQVSMIGGTGVDSPTGSCSARFIVI